MVARNIFSLNNKSVSQSFIVKTGFSVGSFEESRMKIICSPILYVMVVIACLLLSCSQVNLSDARDQYLRGEYYAASETYRKLYRKTSRGKRAQRAIIAFEMGENYRKLNQSARAVVAYGNAIRYGYPDSTMYLHHARMLHREGDYARAAEAYRLFLTFSPNDPIALNGLQGALLAELWREKPSAYVVERMDLFNSNRGEFSPVISPKGFELYFSSSRDEALGEETSPVTGMKYNDLYRAVKNVHGEWQRPKRIDSEVNTEFDEGTPSFSHDGEWMYYTYAGSDSEKPTTTEIYLSRNVNGRWGAGRPLSIVKNDSLWVFAHPAISPLGNFLYFVSDMPGGFGGKDIWRAALKDYDEVLYVENLGPDVNTAGDELFPGLRNDTTLYFSSDGHPGMGGLDLFVAHKSEDGWRVSNLGYPINSSADDFGITFDPEVWSGFFSSNRGDVRGYDHIYSFRIPEPEVWIEGLVVDEEDDFIQGAVVTVKESQGFQLRFVTGTDGAYRFNAQKGGNYRLTAEAEGFLDRSLYVSTENVVKDTTFFADFEMVPFNKPIILDNIFYDFDKASLRSESKDELDQLVALLNEYPFVVIALSAHTDRKGTDDYNLDLSLRRAQSVVDYLVAQGIDERRLSARGLGKSQPAIVTRKLADSYDFLNVGDVLTDEFIERLSPDRQAVADQINRRTSFEVTDQSH